MFKYDRYLSSTRVPVENRETRGTFRAHQNDADQGEHSSNEVSFDAFRFEGKIGLLRVFLEELGGRDEGTGKRDETSTGKLGV